METPIPKFSVKLYPLLIVFYEWGNDMREEKCKFAFNDAAILNQFCDDIVKKSMAKMPSSAEEYRQSQEDIYQAARKRKRQPSPQQNEMINFNLNKKSFEIGFWIYDCEKNHEERSFTIVTPHDKSKVNLKIESNESSRYSTLGYDSDSSGEESFQNSH